jgi:hypothetical protein
LDWYSTFRSAFFGEWTRQGLPESSLDRPTGAGWPAAPCPWLAEVPPGAATHEGIARGLDPATANAVYGFGLFIGAAFGRLHGAAPPTIDSRTAFCAEFNLGISLFDLVCDEGNAADRAALRALPAFQVFTGARSTATPASPVLAVLDRVAASALAKLAQDIGPAGPRRAGLWRTLFAMFDAQIRRTGTTTAQLDDAEALRRILRLSSAEPFRVMSEWMARGPRASPLDLRRAAHLGRCVGDCYWLIDDARDVWDDLYAGRWNRFLLDARAVEPSLSLERPTPFVEARLTHLWEDTRTAERVSRWAVGRLAQALRGLPVSAERAREPIAHIHSSMHHWYA